MEIYYRYWDQLTTNGIYVYRTEYIVEKHTSKGVWINDFGHRRFVLNSARKRFAHPTKEEALESFRARKKRQIKILTRQLERARAALSASLDNNDAALRIQQWQTNTFTN